MKIEKGSLYIAVDGGYAYCKKLGISPGLIIGDMDSLTEGESLCSKGSRNGSLREEIERIEMLCPEKVIRLCREKDDTDMLAALKIGIQGWRCVVTHDDGKQQIVYEGDYYPTNAIANHNSSLALAPYPHLYTGSDRYEIASWPK